MKKLQLHVEVIHNGGEMILALEDNIPEADALRRLKKAQSDPRAFPRLAVDEVDGEVTVTPWKDFEDDDLDSMETEVRGLSCQVSMQGPTCSFWMRQGTAQRGVSSLAD
jgi:hypothetical protein